MKGLFERIKGHLDGTVDISFIDQYQYGNHDAREGAIAMIGQLFGGMEGPDAHPWTADAGTRLKLAHAVVAFAQDDISERILRAADVVTTTRSRRAPRDVAVFAGALAEIAHQRLVEAATYQPGMHIAISDETRINLVADNQVPIWPAFPRRSGYAAYPGQSTDPDMAVSRQFIVGAIDTAKNLAAEAAHGMELIVDRFGLPYDPVDMTSLYDFMLTERIPTGEVQLAYADTHAESFDRLTAPEQGAMLDSARNGLLAQMQNYCAVYAPGVFLGPDWEPGPANN